MLKITDEKTVSLDIKEIQVLKEWFQLVCIYSHVEDRDRKLVEKLAKYETLLSRSKEGE